MSGLQLKRTWMGTMALVAVFGFAACGDDDDGTDNPTAGSAGKGHGGSSGSAHGGEGGAPAAGSANGGKSGSPANGGKAGMNQGGTDTGPGGEGGLGGLGGAAGAGGEGGLSEDDMLRQLYAGTSPLPAVPADPTNAFADNAAAATLGQRFFFDEKFSGALAADSDLGTTNDLQKVSCKSCHSGTALDDERSNPDNISKGTGLHSRNSPSMINSSFYTWTNWGGRFAAQWELPPVVVENGVIMNGTRLAVAHRIYDVYKTDYEAVFGALDAGLATTNGRFPAAGKPTQAAFDGMTGDDKLIVNRILANFGKALQAYTRKLVSREAPFDAWMAGDDNAFTASQRKGARLFFDSGCLNCHGGAHFSDHGFHDLGVPQTGPGVLASDDGRFKDLPGLINSPMNINSVYSDKTDTGKLDGLTATPPEDMKGLFRTPSLRGVAQSAPYMHSGQFADLGAVIDFYAAGPNADTAAGQLTAFTITPQEKADLIAFLGTLTGKPVNAALLTDTAAD